MLGGCRPSLETGVRRDGWRALADTPGHLIFLSPVFLFRTILVDSPVQKKKKWCSLLKNQTAFAFVEMIEAA